METNTITKIATNDKQELSSRYNNFINKLKEDVKKRTQIYHEIGCQIYSFTSEPSELIISDFTEVGIRNLKRFKRYLNQAMTKRSLRSINKLLHIIHKVILKKDVCPKLICQRHDNIQKLKKEWKKQQLIADQLLAEYKKEKGDFYKQDLKF